MAADRVELAQTGEYLGHWQEPYTLTEEDLRQMVQNAGPGPVVIDYEHQTHDPDREEAPAAGWIENLEVQNGSLWGEVTWTDAAETRIDNDEYRYLSPVFNFEATDRETGEPAGTALVTVGLTNVPFMEGMQPVTENEMQRLPAVTASQVLNEKHALSDTPTSNDDPDPMDAESRWKKFKNRIAGIFNTQSDDELDLLDEARKLRNRVDELEDKLDDQEELQEERDQLQDRVDELEGELDDQEEEEEQEQQEEDERIVDEAVENGKIQKSQRDEWLEDMSENRQAVRNAIDRIPEGAAMPGSDSPSAPDHDEPGVPADGVNSDNEFMKYASGGE